MAAKTPLFSAAAMTMPDGETTAEFLWNGYDNLDYTVYIQRGKDDAEHFTRFLMTGTYDPATGKLSADGTCTVFRKNRGTFLTKQLWK